MAAFCPVRMSTMLMPIFIGSSGWPLAHITPPIAWNTPS